MTAVIKNVSLFIPHQKKKRPQKAKCHNNSYHNENGIAATVTELDMETLLASQNARFVSCVTYTDQ